MSITPPLLATTDRPARPTTSRCIERAILTRPTTAGDSFNLSLVGLFWTAPTGHTYQVDPEIIGPLIADDWPPKPEPPPEADPDPPPF
jgi:hypothetical protein